MDQQNRPDNEEAFAREYSRLVLKLIRPFFLRGGDSDDLYQEGMIGLLQAARKYDSSRSDNFEAFAVLCIKRRLYDAVRFDAALSEKEKLASAMLKSVRQTSAEDFSGDPEALWLSNEAAQEIRFKLRGLLSSFEASVLEPYLEGFTAREIADTLSRPAKSVDNAIIRIRRKLAKYLDTGDNRP